jgi:flagellum-specific peptidoglycan hydrolase FlgJ
LPEHPHDVACNAKNAVAFAVTYKPHADPLAQKLQVPVENLLGLAAEESLWGQGDIARKYNNYFSMHAPARYQTGEVAAKRDPKVKVAMFRSFNDCGASFIDRFGQAVQGKSDPTEFAEALVAVHYNTGDSKTGGRDDFVSYLAHIIEMTRRRMNCAP